MRKIILGSLFGILLALGFVNYIKSTDTYIRHNVLLLINPLKGSCTGEQIVYKGQTFVLTAAHCADLAVDGKITAVSEGGSKVDLKIIKESDTTDLLLLEGFPGLPGISVADRSWRHEEIRTLTHGKGHDTYKTVGELLERKIVDVMIRQTFLDPRFKFPPNFCPSKPKFRVAVIEQDFFVFSAKTAVCLLHIELQATQAMIMPGSSGGPALDAYGQLVGVVSAGDGTFGQFVPLHMIKKFLAETI